jgi:hypothetical protein
LFFSYSAVLSLLGIAIFVLGGGRLTTVRGWVALTALVLFIGGVALGDVAVPAQD